MRRSRVDPWRGTPAAQLAANLAREPLASLVVEELRDLAGRAAALWIVDRPARCLQLGAARGFGPALADVLGQIPLHGVHPLPLPSVVATRQSRVIRDLSSRLPGALPEGSGQPPAALCGPIMVQRAAIGAFLVVPGPGRRPGRLRRQIAALQPQWLPLLLRDPSPPAAGIDPVLLPAILEACPVAVVYADRRSGVVQMNRQAEATFGPRSPAHPISIAEVARRIAQPTGDALPPGEAAIQRALRGEVCTAVERLILQPDGEPRAVLESAAPVRSATGQIVGAVGVYPDVTILTEARQHLQSWVSLIAHDLRQPVTVITGFASLLLRLPQGPPSAAERGAVSHILKAASDLNRMVSDLLDLSRLEAGRLALRCQPEDLPALVRAVIERVATVATDQPIQIIADDSLPPVTLDAQRFEQILLNLLSNAAKYGEPGRPIKVRISRRESEVAVAVTNDGPEIPADELPCLFNRFYRTRAATAEPTPGLGLGLYLSRRLVEAHGGRIAAESRPGQTTFTVSLPIAGPPTDPRGESAGGPSIGMADRGQ